MQQQHVDRSARASTSTLLEQLSERKLKFLLTGGQSVRDLVRIKIEDDNDLNTVRQALRESAMFFHELRRYCRTRMDKLSDENHKREPSGARQDRRNGLKRLNEQKRGEFELLLELRSLNS
jgi:hypothetical protein